MNLFTSNAEDQIRLNYLINSLAINFHLPILSDRTRERFLFSDIDINKFELVAKKFTEKGYFVIRLGKKVSKPFSVAKKNPKIIDYPYLKNKSDFVDIFLISESFFVYHLDVVWMN